MLLTNQWLWQWWLCVTANIKHSDSLPACYGDCSKGALGARVLIARRGVWVCTIMRVCVSVWRGVFIDHICVFFACVLVWVWKFNDAQELLMKASCHWSHFMNHTYYCSGNILTLIRNTSQPDPDTFIVSRSTEVSSTLTQITSFTHSLRWL